LIFATLALYGRAGPVTFANRGKSNQKRSPVHPSSSSGARNRRSNRVDTHALSETNRTRSFCAQGRKIDDTSMTWQ